MLKVTIIKALLLQFAVISVGILVLSRPSAESMATMVADEGISRVISADRIAGDANAVKPITQPKPDPVQQSVPEISAADQVALARNMYGRCGEYFGLAMAVGWPADQWPKISKVMYRESRCNFDSFNPTDPNGGSRGLMQINGFWCRPNRYTSQGYLQDYGILKTCDDLYIPEINLRAALQMWLYSEAKNGCGWRPWATSCR